MPRARIIAGLLSSALLAACGGGAHTVPATSAAPRQGSATIRLTIPAPSAPSASRRSPRYVSPSTKSLLITVQSVNAQATTFPAIPLNVVVPSSNCPQPAQGGQSEVCTFSVVLPVGSVTMTIAAYDQTLSGSTPAGNLLSSTTVTQQLSGNGDPILLTLDGVPVSATLALGTPIVPVGTASNVSVTATALDADGNLIVGPGGYANPITVAVTDPSGRVSVAQSSIAAPGASATLAYNGASGLAKVAVTGSGSGITVKAATLAFAPGLVRSDPLPQLTSGVHYLSLSPDASKLSIPFQDASSANTPTLLVVDAATRAVLAHPAIAPGTTATAFNVTYASGDTFVPYSDGNTVNGIAMFITPTSTLTGSSSTAFAPQYLLAAAPPSINGFAYGTLLGNGAVFDLAGITGSTVATSAPVACAVWDQCLAASPDGALIYAADSSAPALVTMHVSDGSAGPTIATPDGPVTAQAFSADGHTLYLASATGGGGTALDQLSYPGGSAPAAFVALPAVQFSALAASGDGATLFGSSSLSPSPMVLIDIASKNVVTFGPAIALGAFAGGFVSPVPIANAGASRRFLVIKEYQQPAGTLHATLDEYAY